MDTKIFETMSAKEMKAFINSLKAQYKQKKTAEKKSKGVFGDNIMDVPFEKVKVVTC